MIRFVFLICIVLISEVFAHSLEEDFSFSGDFDVLQFAVADQGGWWNDKKPKKPKEGVNSNIRKVKDNSHNSKFSVTKLNNKLFSKNNRKVDSLENNAENSDTTTHKDGKGSKFGITKLKEKLFSKSAKKSRARKKNTVIVTNSDLSNSVESDIERVYEQSVELIKDGEYMRALRIINEVTMKYPFFDSSSRLLVLSIFINFVIGDYNKAIDLIDDYKFYHLRDQYTEYVDYMKVMCRFYMVDDIDLDDEVFNRAFNEMSYFLELYGDGEYADSVKRKLFAITDRMAAKLMNVGRLYLNNADYIASLITFANVIDNYPDTCYVPEALYRIVQSLLHLGIEEEAVRYAKLLNYNYPESEWEERVFIMLRDNRVEGFLDIVYQ